MLERELAGREHTKGKEHPDTLLVVSTSARPPLSSPFSLAHTTVVYFLSHPLLYFLHCYLPPPSFPSFLSFFTSPSNPPSFPPSLVLENPLYYIQDINTPLSRRQTLTNQPPLLSHPTMLLYDIFIVQVNNLAVLMKEQGQLSEAKVWYDRALRGLTLTLGPDHATTLDTVYNLANLLHSQVLLTAHPPSHSDTYC